MPSLVQSFFARQLENYLTRDESDALLLLLLFLLLSIFGVGHPSLSFEKKLSLSFFLCLQNVKKNHNLAYTGGPYLSPSLVPKPLKLKSTRV